MSPTTNPQVTPLPIASASGLSLPLPPLTGMRPVNVRVEIRSLESGYVAEIDDGDSLLEDLSIALTPEDVRSRSAALRSEVQSIVNGHDENLAFSQAEAEDALGRLAERGHAAFNQIFGNANARTLLDQVTAGHDRISIEIVADSFVLPWELLYDGDLSQPISLDGFWGFKYILARLFRCRTSGALISTDGPPVVSLFTDTSLNSVATSEIPFFQSLQASGLVMLHPLRPLDNSRRRGEILQALMPFMQQPMQIAHFACHALPGVTSADDASLMLANSFTLSLDDMRAYNLGFKGEPLVVLNACGTGIRDPLLTSNFVRRMLIQGGRGVIATECDVPDVFAAAFVRQLYSEHLLKEETVGEAMLATRRTFAQEYQNPLGLIYALYARAGLRLARR